MPMTNRDALQMLSVLREEILSLRAHVARLQPKAEAYELISKILHVTVKDQGGGMGEDVLWKIDEQRRKIEAEEEAAWAEKLRLAKEREAAKFAREGKATAERTQPEAPFGGRVPSELTEQERREYGFEESEMRIHPAVL